MNSIKRIFSAIDAAYLIRAYLIGFAYFALLTWSALGSSSGPNPAGFIMYLTACLLAFPFAKLVWDELRSLVLGNTVIFTSAFFLFAMKWVINGILFATAIFLAPLGIAYLWLRSGSQDETQA